MVVLVDFVTGMGGGVGGRGMNRWEREVERGLEEGVVGGCVRRAHIRIILLFILVI